VELASGQQLIRRVPHPLGWEPPPPIPRPPRASPSEGRTPKGTAAAPPPPPRVMPTPSPSPPDERPPPTDREELVEDKAASFSAPPTADGVGWPADHPRPFAPPEPPSEAPSEADGYEDDFEFEDEEAALSELVPISTRLVQVMREWGVCDEPPLHVPARLILPTACSPQQSRRAMAAAEWYNLWNNYEFWYEAITVPNCPLGGVPSGITHRPLPRPPPRPPGPGGGRLRGRPPQRPPESDPRRQRTSSVKGSPVPVAERSGSLSPVSTVVPVVLKRSSSAAPNRGMLVHRPPTFI